MLRWIEAWEDYVLRAVILVILGANRGNPLAYLHSQTEMHFIKCSGSSWILGEHEFALMG